jgi:hypothetical protein
MMSCNARESSAPRTPSQRHGALLVLACLSASLTMTRVLHAEPSASDRATARALAGEGYVALTKKDYVVAEDRFRRADELVHAPTLVVDHARALVGQKRFGEAYAALQSVIDEEIPANSPSVWQRAKKTAQVEIEAVKPHVAWLTIRVTKPSEPHVELDGRVLATLALGQRIPANPGECTVRVSAEGYVTEELTQALTEGNDAALTFELLAEPKPEPVVIVTHPVTIDPAKRDAERRSNQNQDLAYVAFGVSGLGFAVGAATGILWLKARGDVTSACGGLTCRASNDVTQNRFEDQQRRYNTLGTLSGIGFGVGVVGAVTGVALILLRPKPNLDAVGKHAHVEPYFDRSTLGLQGAF